MRMRMKMEKSRSSLAIEQIHDMPGVASSHYGSFHADLQAPALNYQTGPAFPSLGNSAGPPVKRLGEVPKTPPMGRTHGIWVLYRFSFQTVEGPLPMLLSLPAPL